MIHPDHSPAQPQTAEPRSLRRLLAQHIDRTLAQRGTRPARRVVQIALPVEPVDPFAWLQAQPFTSRLLWSGRHGRTTVAAVGVADLHTAPAPAGLDALEHDLAPLLAAADAGVRYYGGARFDARRPPEAAWEAFGAYRFVLPRFELRARDEEAVLLCHLVLPDDNARREALLQQVRALRFPAQTFEPSLPLPVARDDRPGFAGWRRNVRWALDAFARTELDKVVLAREATFGFAEPLEPVALLQSLQAATPGCFHFYVQPAAGTAFLGASPERLFRRRGLRVQSEAVAGTRPRGTSDQDDRRLREELLRSEKDQREHAYVRASVREALQPYCHALHVEEEASVMQLARGRHLLSGLRGTLCDGVSSFDLLQALHPTPAVGGHPAPAALEAIRRLEPFDRGWYAGPVGWIGPDRAEFAVGIRSGLVQPDRLALFSGAGIVRGSDPENEWDEIEHKISDFVRVFGLDLRRAE